MELNANLDQRAGVHSARLEWVVSPFKGVQRRVLDGREDAKLCLKTRRLRRIAPPGFARNNFVPDSGQSVDG